MLPFHFFVLLCHATVPPPLAQPRPNTDDTPPILLENLVIRGCTDTALVVDVSGVYGTAGDGSTTYDPDSDGAFAFVRLRNVAFINNTGRGS